MFAGGGLLCLSRLSIHPSFTNTREHLQLHLRVSPGTCFASPAECSIRVPSPLPLSVNCRALGQTDRPPRPTGGEAFRMAYAIAHAKTAVLCFPSTRRLDPFASAFGLCVCCYPFRPSSHLITVSVRPTRPATTWTSAPDRSPAAERPGSRDLAVPSPPDSRPTILGREPGCGHVKLRRTGRGHVGDCQNVRRKRSGL